METVKSTEKYTIMKKKSGRFGVQTPKRKWINGDEKRDILLAEGLITLSKATAKPVEEAPAAEETEAPSILFLYGLT
jgi:hypothetical protein